MLEGEISRNEARQREIRLRRRRNTALACASSPTRADIRPASSKGLIMKRLMKTALLGSLAAVLLAGAASAQTVERIYPPVPTAPIASATVVPPGFTTYYVSGALPTPTTPAANGQPAVYGDTTAQTRSVLDNLKAVMDKMGIGFGDVVAAHVFLDPKADVGAMNKVWSTEFGTAAQPNKPARATVYVHALVAPGALLEIEFTAVKKK
jgi:enamine deaminase RidA (YjgF/YER057c/UK114 family)